MDSESAWLQLLAMGDLPDDEFDDDDAQELVHLLHKRGESVVLDWALPVLADPRVWRREAAARVLGELGYQRGRPFADQVMPALVRAARAERDAEARAAMVAAIGHADDPAWVSELLSYARDDDPAVREVVAGALPIMFAGGELSAEAMAALVTLTADVDPGVRDWATFSLGNQSYYDSVVVREALAARLDDDGGDTRFEAALGLARRGDERALAVIRSRLDDAPETISLLDLEAAAELADPALLPALLRLQEAWASDSDRHTEALAYAIERCEPEARRLAAAAEVAVIDAVNLDLVDIGWRIEAVGGYPATVLAVHSPDGRVDTTHDQARLWELDSPTRFAADAEVARLITTIRGMAAADGAR